MEKNTIGSNINSIIILVSCNRKRMISIIKEINPNIKIKGMIELLFFLFFDLKINMLINKNVDKNIENIESINNIG
ncbi:hypothetical protein [Clostridium sp.]|uniref:hypothetical protein n=1 Tax=Clostridium sp. TaxID=1506 RepID=UPI0025B96BB4|nr:hypothetical protein [Clostridium sp.]